MGARRKAARKRKPPVTSAARLAVALRERKEAIEQQAATAEILKVISSSPRDRRPAFDAILKSALRLCDAHLGVLNLREADGLRTVAQRGGSAEFAAWVFERGVFRPDGGAVLRAVKSGRAFQVADAREGADYRAHKPNITRFIDLGGVRTFLAVPLLKDGEVIGNIGIYRREVRPFTDRQIALVKTFADQAVIAIENARLFNETKSSLARQTSTAEILRVLGGSMTDVQPVFDAIVKNCRELFKGAGVVLRLASNGLLEVKASVGATPGPVPIDRTSIIGTCVVEGRTLHFPDLDEAAKKFPRIRQLGLKYGYRSGMYAPLTRGGKAIGAIGVLRREPGSFDDKDVQLLNTFADQAVIAIENVRLFNETREALEGQTATADILRIVAASVENADPVFAAITRAGQRLVSGSRVGLLVVRDGQLHQAAHSGIPDEQVAILAKHFPAPLDRQTIAGASILDRRVIQVPDIAEVRERFPRSFRAARSSGDRALLVVPLLHGESAVGSLSIRRTKPGAFTARQVELARTFADQAVIAIRNARMFSETKEALEQQTASSEVLGVISSSPTDLKPVFDSILESATRLCDAHLGVLNLYDGENYRTVAQRGSTPEFAAWAFERGAYKPSPVTTLGRMTAARQPIQIADLKDGPAYRAGERIAVKFVELGGARTYLAVPLLQDEKLLGAISIYRPEVRPFTDKQIELVKTFARQAVIAMENVRLFNETKEALEHQGASADILRIVSQSVADSHPAFEAILAAVRRLFDGFDATVWRVEQDRLVAVARGGPTLSSTTGHSVPITPDYAHGIAILERRSVCVDDVASSRELSEVSRQDLLSRNRRAILMVPFVRDGDCVGAISVSRTEPYRFSEKQVALLKTFADQAVIAIENARLFNETKEALEQQTAISVILGVISSSPTDVQPVFDAVLKSATQLCEAHLGVLNLYDGDRFRTVAMRGANPEFAKYVSERGPYRSEGGLARLAAERRPVHIADLREAPSYRERKPNSVKFVELTGARTYLAVPLLKEGTFIGGIVIYRPEVRPFTEKQIALVSTFANQAVIAIENTRLFNETKEALEQQTATAEILKVIAGSPTEVQPVFDVIVERAVRLCGASFGRVYRYDGSIIQMVASHGLSAKGLGQVQRVFPRPAADDTIVGRVILARQPCFIEDVERDPTVPPLSRQMIEALGTRRQLTIPMLRAGEPIGAITLGWDKPAGFDDQQASLLKTFADQAVIAIENVRLFKETKEALERQTATAEILKVIASSPSDVQPVFNAIAASARQLLGGLSGVVTRVDGGMQHLAAFTTSGESGDETLRRLFPVRLGELISGRAVATLAPAIRTDAETDASISEAARESARARGWRSALAVPMVREGVAIGAISVARGMPGSFSDHQIGLLQTFADQAVIAIENVRLFNETKEALEQQTATADILKVISSSPTATQPVFEAIVQSAARLFPPCNVAIVMREGDVVNRKAAAGPNASRIDQARVAGIYPLPFDAARSMAARSMIERRIVEIPDTEAPGLPDIVKPLGRAAGYRAVTVVPLVREGEGIGAIGLSRPEPGFKLTDKQLSLVRTFADQAVIAIQNARLFNETKEALERQTATADVLQVISSSPTNVQPVLDAVAERAARLWGGSDASIHLTEGQLLRLVAHSGPIPDAGIDSTMPIERGFISGRAVLEGRQFHVLDALAEMDEFPGAVSLSVKRGVRTMLVTPLMREGRAIGTIVIRRTEVRPFDDRQIALAKTFADQAVIAIENVRLFRELQERTEALTKSVGQLTALGEVGQAISSSLDLETVLKTIVSRAVQLTGLDAGAVYEYDEGTEEFHLRAAENMSEEMVELLRRTPIKKGDGTVGGTALTREPIQVAEILDGSYQSQFREVLIRTGRRALLAVPLMREGRTIGALAVQRNTPGTFAPEVVELLKTFATQSAMAIQNARLFREIAEKGRQLEVASEHKSQFLASMSHELRTPLNALLGFNEMILGDIYGEVPGDMRPPLAQMQTSGKHLLRLINNVLDLAKIEAGRMELALADYSVQDVVEGVRSTLQPLAAEKGLEFLAAVPADVPLAHGDSGRITQCLMNLAGNSLKFTRAGKVEISVAMNNGQLRYCVADTGIGIPPDKIGSLFTEFRQTDATVASEYGGTGLGLSISKKFVEMHGGRIWVESEPGRGSAFTFEVPLRAAAA